MQLIFRPDLVYTEFTAKGLQLHLQSNDGPSFILVFDDDALGDVVADLLAAYGWERHALQHNEQERIDDQDQLDLPF